MFGLSRVKHQATSKMLDSKLPLLCEATEKAEVVSAGCACSYAENVASVLIYRIKDAEAVGIFAVVIVKSCNGFVQFDYFIKIHDGIQAYIVTCKNSVLNNCEWHVTPTTSKFKLDTLDWQKQHTQPHLQRNKYQKHRITLGS